MKISFFLKCCRKREMSAEPLTEVDKPGDDAEDIHYRHKSVVQRVSELLRDYVVDPSSTFYYHWLGVVSLAAMFNVLVLPVRAVFPSVQRPNRPVWISIDYLMDAVNMLDLFAGSRTGYLEQGLVVRQKLTLLRHYISRFVFKLDIAAVIPMELLSLIPGVGGLDFVWLRFNRLSKIYKLFEHNHRTETRTTFPNFFRIASLVVFLLIIIHWNACLFYLISTSYGLGSDSWVYPPRYLSVDSTAAVNVSAPWDSFANRYAYSFYWSTVTLTTIGETPHPVLGSEFVFMIVEFLGGVLIFATIVGNVGSMITNMNAARTDFQARMDSVKRYMEFRGVSRDLERRVINWFDYLWNHNQSLDEEAILATIPEKLKAEIAIHVHYDTLKHVAIFQDCEPGLLVELVVKLQLQVFSPGDYICRKGDIGKEMYIVKRGKLQVVADDGVTVFVTLNEGSVFGELSILNIAGSKSGNRRTANVRSLGYSDLFCLSKNDLWEALTEYPDAKMLLLERGKAILMKDNLLDLEINERAELGEQGLDYTVGRIAEGVSNLDTRIVRLMDEFHQQQAQLKARLAELEHQVY